MNAQVDPIDRERIRRLMEAAGKSLLGSEVIVGLKPIETDCIGEVFRDSQGKFVIDLHPELGLQTFYRIFLHELGHCFDGSVRSSAIRYDDIPLWSVGKKKTLAEMERHNRAPMEVRANNFVVAVDNVAISKAFELFGEAGIEARLRALASVRLPPWTKGDTHD